VGSSNEDKSLRDDGDLEVDDHVCSGVVGILSDGVNTEFVLEEGSVSHDGVESNSGSSEVETVTDTVGKDLGQIVEGKTRSRDKVMMVPSLRTAMIRTMKEGKSNRQPKAMMAKQTTIRIVTAQA